MALQRGEVVGQQFTLIERLGHGGMGSVWKAQDRNGQVVAIKILHEHLAFDEMFVGRFEREVEVVRRINSENVVRTIGMGRYEGRPFIVMEMVEGLSLRQRIDSSGKVSWPDAKKIVRQIASGLDAVHKEGVTHRDLKPGNVILTPTDVAKIVDFGIARADDLTGLTTTNMTMGTPGYMTPEGIQDESADLYALGCIAYELCTGKRAFPGATVTEVAHIQRTGRLDLSPLPGEARVVVGWLLAEDRRRRPANASSVVRVLDGQSAAPRIPNEARKRKGFAAALLVAVLLIGLGAAGFVVTRDVSSTEFSIAPGPGAVYTPKENTNGLAYVVTLFVRDGREIEVEFAVTVQCRPGVASANWTADAGKTNVVLLLTDGLAVPISGGSGIANRTEQIPCRESRTGSWLFRVPENTEGEPATLSYPVPEFSVPIPTAELWKPVTRLQSIRESDHMLKGDCIEYYDEPKLTTHSQQFCAGVDLVLEMDRFDFGPGASWARVSNPIAGWLRLNE